MNPDRHFRLFACCLPVKGAARSTLCDIQRKSYHLIPNALYTILTEHRDKNLQQIKAMYDPEHEEVIDEYFTFLIENELGFWTTEPENFPDLELTFEKPELINNAIVDVDHRTQLDFENIFRQLDDVGCRVVQLRFFTPWDLDRLERQVLTHLDRGSLRGLELILQDDPRWSDGQLDKLCRRHNRITAIFIHSAEAVRTRRVKGLEVWICHRTEKLRSHEHCGQVHPDYFAPTYDCFLEAQRHNTCLHRKISIDARGDIKNCPSMATSFGNIRDTSLHEAIAMKGFRDLWQINKDQIAVCKDCEFRYICTDCRAFISDPDDLYSKPSKCSYDPYNATWQDTEPST